jgi:hypothetical protein
MRLPADDTSHAELAARVLASEDASEAAIGLGDRQADLAAIEGALRSRARGRWRRWTVGLGQAVAAIVLVMVAQRSPSPDGGRAAAPTPSRPPALSIATVEGIGASVEVAGRARPLRAGDAIAPGARLQIPASGGMMLALDTGTRLDLAGGTTARVVELGGVQRFDLAAGRVVAQVAKLGPGGRFIVATPDSEVEVKGTRFEVSVGSEPSPCGPPVRTRVIVHEGVVAVRHAGDVVELGAGRHWPDCQPLERPGLRPRHSRAAPSPAASVPPVAPRLAATTDATRASTLAEQNDLFAAALEASRRGDFDEAVHWLDRLIARHPTGQLTDSARAERRRLSEARPQER